MQTPYKPLNSLEDPAEKVQEYTVPEEVQKEYKRNVVEGRREAVRYGRPLPF
jgi:hypothetical protein